MVTETTEKPKTLEAATEVCSNQLEKRLPSHSLCPCEVTSSDIKDYEKCAHYNHLKIS